MTQGRVPFRDERTGSDPVSQASCHGLVFLRRQGKRMNFSGDDLCHINVTNLKNH